MSWIAIANNLDSKKLVKLILLLIAVLAVAYLSEKAFLAVESAELVTVRVKVERLESRERQHLRC